MAESSTAAAETMLHPSDAEETEADLFYTQVDDLASKADQVIAKPLIFLSLTCKRNWRNNLL
jgi:hypothetical protein